MTKQARSQLAQQAQLLESLEEIDTKLNRYNSPTAKQIIDNQIEYVKAEKAQLQNKTN